MARTKTRSSKKLVLDIGTSAVRLCELTQSKAGLQLTKYYQRDFHIDPAMDDVDKQERRGEVLAALLKEAKVRARKTIVAVPGQSVFTRNRPLPPVPEHKVTQIVRYEIQQQIPFSLNEIALDYQVLDRTEVGGYDVMMAAIKVDVVEKQLDILNKVKRAVDTVDVSPMAAYNWLIHTGDFGDDGQCIAMVDMGATTTDIVIQKDNQFKFTRSLHVGGNDVTAALSSAFNMPFEEAERLKREKAFAPTGDAQRDGRGGEVTGRILGRLVGEINRSFAYFRSQPGGGPVTRVVITGGGSCLRNIIPYLQRMLNIEVRIAQPLAGLAIAPSANEASQFPEQACVALGLALRTVQTVPIEINLIPPRIRELSKRKEQGFYWVLTFVAIYLIMASTIPVTAQKDEIVKERIKSLKSVLGKYDPALINNPTVNSSYEDDLNVIKTEIGLYEQEIKVLDDLRTAQHFWLPEIQMITDARPLGIGISSLQTVVLGGPTNTGSNFRNAGAGATVTSPSTPVAAPSSRPGERQLGMNIGAVGPGNFKIQAFPGIIVPNSGTVVEPNGIALFGYAYDVKTVQEFKRRLEESSAIIENGVYFHVKELKPVPESELDNASFGDLSAAVVQSTSSDSSEKGIGGSLGNLNISNFTPDSSGSGEGGPEVIKFQIEVQFLGKSIEFDDK